MREKKFYRGELKANDTDKLIVEHFISTEEMDRSGDIVRAEGMQLDGVPSVLKQHGMDPAQGSEPIARNISISVAKDAKGRPGIKVVTQYYDGSHLTPPDNTGRRLYEKAVGGFMPYWSIGFGIEKFEPLPGGGRDIKRWWIYEYSQVGVPDNPTADVIKALDADPTTGTEIIGFAMAKVDVEPAKILTPVPEEKKMLRERLSMSVPWEALHSAFAMYIDAIVYSAASEKDLKALNKEYSEICAEHSAAFWAAIQPKSDEEKAAIIEHVKFLTHPTRQVSEVKTETPAEQAPETPAAPAPAPTVEPEQPPVETPEPAPVAPEPDPVPVLVMVDEPVTETIQLAEGITREQITEVARSAVRAEIGAALGRLPDTM